MDFGVAGVLGQGFREIAEIAVEVDIILGHAANMGEPVRVDGVRYQHGDRFRAGVDDALPDEAGLAAGAAKPLVAVRAGDDDEKGLRIHGAEPGDVRGELLALRAAGVRIGMSFDCGVGRAGGLKEFLPRLRIGWREILRNSHGARLTPLRVCWGRLLRTGRTCALSFDSSHRTVAFLIAVENGAQQRRIAPAPPSPWRFPN